MSELQIDYDVYRPAVCAFFAGRAWYAGINSKSKLGWVMFSQVLDDIGNIYKCYQENDPTSEVFSDIKDSDGGVIQIPEVGEITGLVALSKALFVFGSNGVWQIIGGDNGFTASSYSVEKVSSIGCLFQKTIVTVEDTILYWSHAGIYAISVDTTGLTAQVKNISDQTIKTLYQAIPTINKIYVDGKYNDSDKLVHWLYSDAADLIASGGNYVKNRVLAFDLALAVFYTYTLDTSVGPQVVSLGTTKETATSEINFNVLVNLDTVLSNTDTVIAAIPTLTGSTKQFKYFTLIPDAIAGRGAYSITFSDYAHTYFTDWYSYNTVGAEVASYLITGYNMGGVGPTRAKTGSYIHMFMKRTESTFDANTEPTLPSGIKMQTRWDFTDNTYPGKWSDEVQVYRQLRPYFAQANAAFEDGYPLVITKNKIRGRGKALQVKLSAETGKDMQIVGWSTGYIGNTNV